MHLELSELEAMLLSHAKLANHWHKAAIERPRTTGQYWIARNLGQCKIESAAESRTDPVTIIELGLWHRTRERSLWRSRVTGEELTDVMAWAEVFGPPYWPGTAIQPLG
jgi:hypothetical protein